MRPQYTELPSVERQYRRLRALGLELGIPVPEMWLEMRVVMPGDRTVHWHRQRSHSWTRNAYNTLLSTMAAINAADASFGAGFVSLKDTGGSTRSGSDPLNLAQADCTAVTGGYLGTSASTSNGIVVGTSSQAESFEDYHLITLVANGTGAGQLAYVASSSYSATYTAGTKTWAVVFSRFFNNNSGGTVGINEVGIYGHNQIGASGYTGLPTRDVLGATVNVLDTGQLKVTYTFSLTYPS